MGRPENYLLSVLPSADYERLLETRQDVRLARGEALYESGELPEHVYFPTTSVISLLYTMEDGASTEMAMVGNDGMLGLALILGGQSMPHRAISLAAGHAIRIHAAALQREFARGGALQAALLRYTQALLTQISQNAVCNRRHSMDQRLRRWLLLCLDRIASDEITMTQEFISHMLGGRRESVTLAAARLQQAGVIHYSRGHIKVLDRAALESDVCECYGTVKVEIERLWQIDEFTRRNTESNVACGSINGSGRHAFSRHDRSPSALANWDECNRAR